MFPSSCNGRNACERIHLHGNISIGVGPIAECTIGIVSPSPHRAVIFQGKGMESSSSERSDASERTQLYRHIAGDAAPIAKFTIGTVSPSHRRVINANGKGMNSATSDQLSSDRG